MKDPVNAPTPNRRLLIVSSYAPPMTGGPQNLYNLFSQFPAESYCILTSYEAIRRGKPRGTWLAGDYFFYDHAGRTEKSHPSVSANHDSGLLARTYGSIAEAAERLPPMGKELLLPALQALLLLRSVRMILQTAPPIVRSRKIECIIGISDTGPALISTYLMSRRTGIPFVLYLFDIYLGNRLPLYNDLLARIFEPLLFKHASLVIVTNEATERFYRNRYGHSFRCAIVHNSVFPEAYASKRTIYSPKEPYIVVFTGHVYWAQERSLMNLIRALDGIELPVQANLYVPVASEAFRRSIAEFTNVCLSTAPQSEMPDIQSHATILFLPLSWHTKRPGVIATATPGKLTDYLASGRPILVHAPPYAYVGLYARLGRFALVVDEDDIQKLRDSIKRLVVDVGYSRQLIKNAQKTLRKNHDATTNARRLACLLGSVKKGILC